MGGGGEACPEKVSGFCCLLLTRDRPESRKQKTEAQAAPRGPPECCGKMQKTETRIQKMKPNPGRRGEGGRRMQNAENRTPLREGERRGRKQNFRVERASRREVWELRRRKREKTEKTGGQ